MIEFVTGRDPGDEASEDLKRDTYIAKTARPRCQRCNRAIGCRCCTFCRWDKLELRASGRVFECRTCGRQVCVRRNRTREIQFRVRRVQPTVMELLDETNA